MITAKNYAAQAERGLILFSQHPDAHQIDRKFAKMFSRHIGDCAHFVIPDDGEIFNDRLKGLEGKILELPYGAITIEFYLSGKWTNGIPGKAIIKATDDGDGIIVSAATVYQGFDIWMPIAYTMRVPKDINMNRKRSNTMTSSRVSCPGILEKVGNDESHKSIGSFELCLEELLEALSCKNIVTVSHQQASPANDKRIKAGKLPFYETKMLVIDSHASSTSNSGYRGGSHVTPRQHLRRGHIRRLPSGNIWVNSCVVGDPTKGIIKKQYSVI